jgi:HEPN domain-containing protein
MQQPKSLTQLNHIAESYAKLVLAVGQHDADYVDAFYGPESWKQEAVSAKKSLDAIKNTAVAVARELNDLDSSDHEEIEQLRHHYLQKQLQSLIARVDLLGGGKRTFDEESEALYDAVAPTYSESYFKSIMQELGGLLPGHGPVPERYDRYKEDFIIPKEQLDRVFKVAIDESRKRTRKYIALPDNESFTVEYVRNKSWSGYNWYKGNSHSLIQMNTDLPIYIDRAIDLASHEGYPGHHVYNALLEENLVKKRGWVEFTVYALFSPQSLIAEGTANYGIEMAFPKDQRVSYERDVLFPLAGCDASQAESYYRIHELFLKLAYAGNEAARQYLNGAMNREQAAEWLVSYALMSPDRARQRTRFFDQYRSYVINYNLGQDLVKNYIEKRCGPSSDPDRRWKEFTNLISSPRLPSGLR